MEFVFSGFRHDGNVRVFKFVGIAEDRTRSAFRVDADLSLLRRHGITLQEAPLLCRRLLDGMEDDARTPVITFSEQEMAALASERAEIAKAAALKKRPWHARKPVEAKE